MYITQEVLWSSWIITVLESKNEFSKTCWIPQVLQKSPTHATLSTDKAEVASGQVCWGSEVFPLQRCFHLESQQNGSDHNFCTYLLFESCLHVILSAAHLIKSKHIYHLIKAGFMATPQWRLRWKYPSSSLFGTSVRGTLGQAMEVLISQYQNNWTCNTCRRGCHWWFLLVYCGYWVLLMCVLELSRWTNKWTDAKKTIMLINVHWLLV